MTDKDKLEVVQRQLAIATDALKEMKSCTMVGSAKCIAERALERINWIKEKFK